MKDDVEEMKAAVNMIDVGPCIKCGHPPRCHGLEHCADMVGSKVCENYIPDPYLAIKLLQAEDAPTRRATCCPDGEFVELSDGSCANCGASKERHAEVRAQAKDAPTPEARLCVCGHSEHLGACNALGCACVALRPSFVSQEYREALAAKGIEIEGFPAKPEVAAASEGQETCGQTRGEQVCGRPKGHSAKAHMSDAGRFWYGDLRDTGKAEGVPLPKPPQYDECYAELRLHLANDLGLGIMAVRPDVLSRVLEYHDALEARNAELETERDKLKEVCNLNIRDSAEMWMKELGKRFKLEAKVSTLETKLADALTTPSSQP